MTVREALAEGKKLLASPSSCFSTYTPSLDASLLLCRVLSFSRENLIVRAGEKIQENKREEFIRLVERRMAGECVAYILGRKEFRGLVFNVNPNVLVPRPDTEILVEAALEYIDSMAEKAGKISLLDLCTGSGAVAVSLKSERPFIEVSASDISPEALETAVHNAAALSHNEAAGLYSGGIRFIESDLFENVSGKFNIIVSNPPYIPSDEYINLAPEVLREPRLALDGGRYGLDIIRRIVTVSGEHLLAGGILLLEADPAQMPEIASLLKANLFRDIKVRKDLAGNERVISALLN